MSNSTLAIKAVAEAQKSVAKSREEMKAEIRKKAFDCGDSIDFFITHSEVEFNQIVKNNVMSAWKYFRHGKDFYLSFLLGSLFLMLAVPSVFIKTLNDGYQDTVNQVGVLTTVLLLLFGFLIGAIVTLFFGYFAWDVGGKHLISCWRKGHARYFFNEVEWKANNVIGVGRDRLYGHVNNSGHDYETDIRKIEYDAIGDIDAVAYAVQKRGREGQEIENEITILDRFGRVGLNMTNFTADKDVDVIGELKRRRDEAQ